ncbi:MAG: translocation/assembly module TamB domain-containing protein [Gammaproteobacteria bacterium]|nr:translocation/assembly module TamB domain-containing protein [Gammaproteobacteria bacterium]
MHKAVKWSIGGITVVGLLALVLIITLVVILNTASGSRWAIDRISSALPGELRADDFDGTLWRGLRFPTLVYRDDDQEIKAVELALSFDWSTIAARRLTLDAVDATTVEIRELGETEPVTKPLELSMEALPIEIAIRRVTVGEIAIGDNTETTSFFGIAIDNVRIDGNAIRIKNASASTAEITVSATNLSMTLQGDVPVSADIQWNLADGSWSGFGTLNDSLAELSFEQNVTGAYPGVVTGSVKLLNRIEPEFDALVSWDSWSFGEYQLLNGDVHLQGQIGQYDAHYDVAVTLPGALRFQVTGTATGDTEKLTAFDAQLDGLAGRADVSGSLAWTPAFVAETQVAASNIDPAAFARELSGKLDAVASVTIDDASTVSVANMTVTGDLNGAPVMAAGNLLLAPQRLQCNSCSLAVGRNELRFSGGSSDDEIALSLSIDAPHLSELWPDLAGAASGSGSLRGSFDSPRFTGTLSAREVAFRDWSALSIDISSRESARETLDASAKVVSLFNGDVDLGAFTVAARGQITEFEVDAEWNLRDLNLRAAGRLGRKGEDIDGLIRTASLSVPNTGVWSLEDALAFQLSGAALSVEPHVWSGASGALRVSRFVVVDNDVTLVAGLANFPLQIANTFLPENLQLLGFANADVNLHQLAGRWSGSIDWRQSDTILRVAQFNDQITDVVIPSATVEARLSNGGVVAKATVSVEPGVSGELDVELANLAVDSPMTGELRLQGDNWGWISAVVPQIDGFEGSVDASVSAAGPLTAPEFSGSIAWRNGRLLLPALNVPLDNVDLVISGASQGTATLTASAKAGDGTLGVTGQFDDLMRPARSVTLNLTGNSAEMINWPEYHLWATPDLVIIGSTAGWQINGEVTVPRADIAFREIPVEAVTISPDVVVLGEEDVAVTATRYSGQARLLLGERVRFNAMGLDTGLSGDLLLRMPEDRPLRAEGQVSLVDGIFAAYGQKLTIAAGTLTFTGPPDDPIVDVRAVRVIETFEGTVTAGIHLRGRAQNLTSTVFSEPKMADADALSYLVIGRPLNQATESEGGELSGAAVALGLRQATRLTEQIGQAVGLDQLSLTGDGGETTALVAGKQINSRLYARYAYGVFSRLGTLVLRYKLSRRVALEAGAGETQSIDVLYSVEKD